ncbi:MAG: DUF6702 family protein [Mucilaginibacter sp.]
MTILLYRGAIWIGLFANLLPVNLSNHKPVFHPIHVSTTEVNYNGQDNKLEVTCTLFVDDFELGLEKQYHSKADLQKPALHTAMDVLVKNYLHDHLQIKNGNSTTSLNYLGFEINKEAVNIYLESDKTQTPKKIGIEVSLLHNIFTDQINIVHISVGGIRKSGKLEYPDKNIEQTF